MAWMPSLLLLALCALAVAGAPSSSSEAAAATSRSSRYSFHHGEERFAPSLSTRMQALEEQLAELTFISEETIKHVQYQTYLSQQLRGALCSFMPEGFPFPEFEYNEPPTDTKKKGKKGKAKKKAKEAPASRPRAPAFYSQFQLPDFEQAHMPASAKAGKKKKKY